MANTVAHPTTATLLDAVYKNVKMASDALITLMPKVKDDMLKGDMTRQISEYERFASRAAALLEQEGGKPEEENLLTRVSAKMGMNMNTMRDSTSTHIAEMLIEGTTMGINDMLKQIRTHENSSASEASLRLAREVCDYEEKLIPALKDYLR